MLKNSLIVLLLRALSQNRRHSFFCNEDFVIPLSSPVSVWADHPLVIWGGESQLIQQLLCGSTLTPPSKSIGILHLHLSSISLLLTAWEIPTAHQSWGTDLWETQKIQKEPPMQWHISRTESQNEDWITQCFCSQLQLNNYQLSGVDPLSGVWL